MPGQFIDQPNPDPLPSDINDQVLSLAIQPTSSAQLGDDEAYGLAEFQRASNYIAAAMIFLRGNTLLERDVTFDDVKPRLLGHWGTCPGLTLIYAHLSLAIKTFSRDFMLTVGPGHGAPAVLASLWLEGSLGRFYPEYGRDFAGLDRLITGFSTPSGFPSHVSAETPGAIHEGGELGYALSVAFGSVMDNPNLINCCVVGDGEAETGPTAGSWHAAKYIDPAESGAVLPILHVNGFKISERTIYGCMDNKEILALFTGYGYQCRIVQDLDNIDGDLKASMSWAIQEINEIQQLARAGRPRTKARWPMLVLRTPKGWGCPKESHGQFIEGSFRAHQVPLVKAKVDEEERALLSQWLHSYRPDDLFDQDGNIKHSIIGILPEIQGRRLGQQKVVYDSHQPLCIPDWQEFSVEKNTRTSPMKALGNLLDRVIIQNPKSMRIFSPDELESNKLGKVLEHTGRNFQWDQFSRSRGGRVIEILSEHVCQGMLQGYTLTGRTGLFPSYESFLGIVHTMMVQYSKFQKMARETKWRQEVSSINYLETSTWVRQEHNGFSHQNPSFIGAVLNIKSAAARVYLPPDTNSMLSTMAHCLRSRNYVNLVVGSKHELTTYLSAEEADAHCRAGASIFKFASTEDGLYPDVVLVGIGAELTFEVIAAASMLRSIAPSLRVRVVNVTDLMILEHEGRHPHALSYEDFNALFTADRPVVINYHSYPQELQGLLFKRPILDRLTIAGYREEGSTTTPFDMLLRNEVSRHHVCQAAIRGGARWNDRIRLDLHQNLSNLAHDMVQIKKHILRTGADPDDLFATPSFSFARK